MADEGSSVSHTRQTRKLRAGSKSPTHSLAPSGDLNLVLRQSFSKPSWKRRRHKGPSKLALPLFIITRHRGSLRNGGMIEMQIQKQVGTYKN